MQGPKVLEHAEVEHVLGGGYGDPLVEKPLPFGEAVAPLGVTGHDVAGAAGNADLFEGIDEAGGEPFDFAKFLRRQVVNVNYGAVLIGAQGLFAPSFAAKGKVGCPFGEADTLAVFQQGNQAQGYGVVEL